ncbi:MAG: hypothetical protein RML40_10125 [Bacteroidota bacterium]|nr:hypothetical protein [Candidatus Kapabacteria bacterium]MDW8220876.1 hypothetical protein [Bacteroidota bacterium]
MSKGGAGKVYFVLYLAVILELLIIIVERDEAEEGLHKKTRESMRIVQNILSQLQSGSGNFNMNVAPNDLIIVQDRATVEALPPDQRIKRQKTYSVKVGVTDVSDIKLSSERAGETQEEEKEGVKDYTLTKLANVQELTYQLFYTETNKGETQQEIAPRLPDSIYNGKRLREFKTGDVATYIDQQTGRTFNWTLLDNRQLKLDVPATYEYNKLDGGWRKPLYSLSINGVPVDKATQARDTIFFYDSTKSEKDIVNIGKLLARTFTVNFDPGEERRDGWYKLRFFSSTNKILGIDFDGGVKEIKDEDQINVGVVKLKVKALRSVLRELERELDGKLELRDRWYDGEGDFGARLKAVEEFNAAIKLGRENNKDNEEILNKITLYDYIVKLLTPGFSSFLDQNSGTIDIDVQVRKPEQQQPAPSISELDPKIIIFDKLQKTIIPFALTPSSYFKPGNPAVEIKGTPSLAGKYKIELDEAVASSAPLDPQAGIKKRRYRMVFDSPIPEGKYTITLSYSGGGKTDTASTELRVLPSKMEEKSMKTLAATKLYYGKRLSLRSKLLPEAELPLQQFKIDYQLGNEKKNADNPYSESWVGPNIPATAKKVKVDIVWVYPATGERVPLFSREIQPDQTPPEIACMNAVAELKSSSAAETARGRRPTGKKPVRPNDFQIVIKGIGVDYEVPIDADNRDPAASKSIKATLNDVEPVGDAEVDYNSQDTQLRIYNGDEPDPTSTWVPNASTFSVVTGAFDASTGVFPVVISVKDLPPKPPGESRILRGTVAIKVGAKIVNRKAGASAPSQTPPCVIPINIPYQ